MSRKVYRATAPSNIAFLKYWGKRPGAVQWPANNSLSMTLGKARTQTDAYLASHKDHAIRLSQNALDRGSASGKKVYAHLDFLADRFGFSDKLAIETSNTFPTGCGIASSASGLAALTIAALAAWTQSDSFEQLTTKGFDIETLAHLSRLGSGSAGRSLFGGYVHWEAGDNAESQKINPVFSEKHWTLSDVIVVVSNEEKKISSSEGHTYAWSSPLFAARLSGLAEREAAMLAAIKRRDIHALGPLLEHDALEMHSIMASMTPPAYYLTAKSNELISWVRQLRKAQHIPVYFTIDAGPNLHLICETSEVPRLLTHLEEVVPADQILVDGVGEGPTLRLAE